MLFIGLLMLGGCATSPRSDEGVVRIPHPADKYETMNRKIFAFNVKMDRWFLKPVAQAYDWATPTFAKRGVRNFFSNLGEINNVVNDVLQGKAKQASNDTGRFLTNSTIGVFGLFDIANKIGLEKSDGEDFGQTFAKWGYADSNYIMLPFLGPTTVRDGVGLPLDYLANPVTYVKPSTTAYGLGVVDLVDTRAQILQAEELASGDLYVFVRDTYLKRREFLLNDGVVVDTFGEEDF